ncbi:MAG TPA: hypothetical protein PLY77_00985 [Plasticicumulans sp.]|nr:hypothetical protein [Plasticicumulans sp.]
MKINNLFILINIKDIHAQFAAGVGEWAFRETESAAGGERTPAIS